MVQNATWRLKKKKKNFYMESVKKASDKGREERMIDIGVRNVGMMQSPLDLR